MEPDTPSPAEIDHSPVEERRPYAVMEEPAEPPTIDTNTYSQTVDPKTIVLAHAELDDTFHNRLTSLNARVAYLEMCIREVHEAILHHQAKLDQRDDVSPSATYINAIEKHGILSAEARAALDHCLKHKAEVAIDEEISKELSKHLDIRRKELKDAVKELSELTSRGEVHDRA